MTVLCASGGYAGGEKQRVDSGSRIADSGLGMEDAECGKAASHPSAIYNPQSTIPSSSFHPSTIQNPKSSILNPQSPIRIVRIGATKFGRGTFAGKLLDYLSYYLGVAWRLLVMQPRPDRIIALTTPPYLSVLARAVSKLRGADHAHWVMDLYPDVMSAHGMLDERSVPYRILSFLTRWGFGGRRCAIVLTLGPDMAERVGRYLERKGIVDRGSQMGDREKKVKWVPLWATAEGGAQRAEGGARIVDSGLGIGDAECGKAASHPSTIHNPQSTIPSSSSPSSKIQNPKSKISISSLRAARGWREGEMVVMYSGNMGLGHRFGEVLEAARQMAGKPVRFVFFGGGKRRQELEEFARNHPQCAVEVHDYAPAEILTAHLQSADVHLASLDANWTGTMVPSKLQGIFVAGRPVIFVGSSESSIGRWVLESGGGWTLAPEDVAGLLAALAESRNPETRALRGRAAKAFAEGNFDKSTNVIRVAGILAEKNR